MFFSIAPCFVFRPKKTEEPPKKTDMDQSKKEGKEGDTSDSDSDDADDIIGKSIYQGFGSGSARIRMFLPGQTGKEMME